MQQQLKHQDGLPHDRQTEVNVLGTVIRNNELFADTSDGISKESFYETKLSDIWR